MKKILILIVFLTSFLHAADDKSLIIVTTNEVRDGSSKLSEFISEKDKRGFKVLLATEDDFGGEDVKGQEKVFLIRNWLKDNYEGYSHLLLIGNPHEKYGQIPMLNTYIRGEGASGGPISDMDITTDQYYGYLEENWDTNGDGIYAEYSKDSDGFLFTPSIIVGRIPYYGDLDELDGILDTAIKYMNANENEISYRKKALLPMSFIWFEGYVNVGVEMDENRDTADTAEWMIDNVFKEHRDVSYTRLYEEDGHMPSIHDHELPLSGENIISEWETGYGMVYWGGHGQYNSVVKTVWGEDKNNNNKAENDEVYSEILLQTGDFENFNNDTPAFVIGLSCLIGDVVPRGNITYDMLKNGAAVGVISSTHIDDPSFSTDWSDLDTEPSKVDFTLDTIGIKVFDAMLLGERPSKVLVDLRSEFGNPLNLRSFEHKLMINYYGDPTLTLYETAVEDETDESEISDSEIEDTEINDETSEPQDDDSGCSAIIIR